MTCWCCITPLVLTFVLIMTFVQYTPAYSYSFEPPDYKYVFPAGIQLLGWLMALVAVVIIPVMGLVQFKRRKDNGQPTDLRSMFTPNSKWGPSIVTNAKTKRPETNNEAYLNQGFKYTVETTN